MSTITPDTIRSEVEEAIMTSFVVKDNDEQQKKVKSIIAAGQYLGKIRKCLDQFGEEKQELHLYRFRRRRNIPNLLLDFTVLLN